MTVWAQGPGIGQVDFIAEELFTPVAVLDTANGLPSDGGESVLGVGHVAVHRGYLLAPIARNATRQNLPGTFMNGLVVMAVGDPRNPQVVALKQDASTAEVREGHGFGVATNDIMVTQARNGLLIFDVSDPLNIQTLANPRFDPQMSNDDIETYADSVWWVHLQYPYAYASGLNRGLHIFDVSKPEAEMHVATLPRAAYGNFSIGSVWAIGNLLYLSGRDPADPNGLATVDISDPTAPQVLDITSLSGDYASAPYGDTYFHTERIPTGGRLLRVDVTDPTSLSPLPALPLAPSRVGNEVLYVMPQDEFLHLPGFNYYGKARLPDLTDLQVTTFDEVPGVLQPSNLYEFSSPIGNFVVGAGGGNGAGVRIVPHQAGRDVRPPEVKRVVPAGDAVQQPVTSRVGIQFSDWIDLASLNATSFAVRPWGTSGAGVPGVYSHQFGVVNFTPDAPLQEDTTYEIFLPAGGVRDVSGNGLGADVSVRFSTGATVATPDDSAPLFLSHPVDQNVVVGQTVQLQVLVDGYPAPVIQWSKDGEAIDGATGPVYVFVADADSAGEYSASATNGSGDANSDPSTITVVPPNEAPVIFSSPEAVSALTGETVSLSVTASGHPEPTFQWFKDGDLISGAIAPDISFDATLADTGEYAVIVQNNLGSVASDPVTVSVADAPGAPTIVADPEGIQVTEGQPFALQATIQAVRLASLQWQKDGVDIPGATQRTFASAAAAPEDAGEYVLVATNSEGSATSQAALLIVDPGSAPTIDVQPTDQAAPLGLPVTFTVEASGVPEPTFQWRRLGLPIVGETQATLTVIARPANSGTYDVVVASALGEVVSDPVSLIQLPPLTSPVIVTQPTDAAAVEGETAQFFVEATGNPAPDYQWQLEGVDLPDETSALLSFAAELSSAGNYRVVVSNSEGTVTSDVAELLVAPAEQAPVITDQPTSTGAVVAVIEGEEVTLSVAADGFPPPEFQWRKDGVDLAGEVASSLTFSAQLADAGQYEVVVSNRVGSVLSESVSVDVSPPPSAPVFVTQPSSQSASIGQSVELTVAVTGHPPPDIVWQKDGVDIPGADGPSYSFVVAADDEGSYRAVASNSEGNAVSDAASLTLVADTTPPTLVDILQNADGSLTLEFSEEVSASTAEEIANYQLSPNGLVLGATQTSLTTVRIEPYTLQGGREYTLSVSGVEDVSGNAIASNSTIVFTTAPDTPGPSTISFVVFSLNLLPGDQAVVDRLTALGHTVLLHSHDGITQAETAGSDAVLVSSTVYSGWVGPTFRDDPRPVMVWEGYLFDDLGLTGDVADADYGVVHDQTSIALADVTVHTIARGFAAGALTTSLAPRSVAWGLPAVGAQVVATTAGDVNRASVFTYDVGVVLANGSPAAGKRLGWYMTDHGLSGVSAEVGTLFDQAITWLLSTAPPPPPEPFPPNISSQPQDQNVVEGETVTLSVVAEGIPEPTYQWQKAGQDILGAVAPTITFTAALEDAGSYRVVITNALGSVASDPADVQVSEAPVAPEITLHPVGVDVLTGDTVSLSISATGIPAPQYQWMKDSVPIPGAVTDTLSFVATLEDAGSYESVATNSEGSVTSQPALVGVTLAPFAPTITAQPQGVVVSEGESVTLQVGVSAHPAHTTQWYLDGVAVAGATGDTLNFAASLTNDGTYTAMAANSEGSTTSDEAVVNVIADITPPNVDNIFLHADQTLELTFSEPVDADSAGLLANYALSAGAVLNSVEVITPLNVRLTPSPLIGGSQYALTVNGVEDLAGNAIAADTTVAFNTPPDTAPASTISFVVFAVDLLPGDQAVFDRLTALGHTVLLHSHDGITLQQTAGSDAVIISSTVYSGWVGAIFKDDPRPVMLWEGYLFDDFALTGAITDADYGVVHDQTGILLTDVTQHTIARGLPIGPLVTRDGGQSVAWGLPAASAQVVATTQSDVNRASIFTYEPGDTLVDGSAATGKRLSWYMDNNGLSDANAQTQTLFEQALTWLLTTAPPPPPVPSAPVITTQPQPQTVVVGDPVTLSVVATGIPVPSYRWQKYGSDIPGANAASITFTSVLEDTGSYQVVVSNALGSVVSDAVTITVEEAPTAPEFSVHPESQDVLTGDTVTLSVSVSGNPSPDLQWFKDGVLISGAAGTTLTFVAEEGDAGSYVAVATNSVASVSSNVATLSVALAPFAPAFTSHPQGTIVSEGAVVVLQAVVSGHPQPTLQWYRDGVAVNGAVSDTLSFTASLTNDGDYTVVASNSERSVSSDVATVSVIADVTRPTLLSAQLMGDQRIALTFSEAVDAGTAGVTAGYAFNLGASITSVEIVSPESVYLTPTPLAGDTQYTLSVSGVEDVSGNAIASNSTIVFTTAPDTPGPSTISFVVFSLNLLPGDQAVVDRLTALGHTVLLHSHDGITQAETAGSDAVLVSSTVYSGWVGPTFRDDPRPVMVWEGYLFDDLGLTGDVADADYGVVHDQTSIALADVTVHTIARGFAAGALTTSLAPRSVAWGLPAVGAQVVATTAGDVNRASVFTYDVGVVLANGSPAAGKRLGWYMTDHGLSGVSAEVGTLFDQAITWLLSTAPPPPELTAPVIAQQPQSMEVIEGDAVLFAVVATGNPTPTYTWRKDGVPLQGAIGSSISFNAVPADAGDYTVLVTNSQGEVLSAPATLDVVELIAPTILQQPQNQSVSTGDQVTLVAQVSGSPAPTLQWRKNGVDLVGENADTLTFTAVSGDTASYTLFAQNAAGNVLSDAATVTVTDGVLAVEPLTTTARSIGEAVTFSAPAVSGASGSPEFAWDFGDGSPQTEFSSDVQAEHTYVAPGHFTVLLRVRAANGQVTTTASQTVHRPLMAASPSRSNGTLLDASNSKLWVANPDNASVTIIDTTTAGGSLLETQSTCLRPVAIAKPLDGSIWVLCRDEAVIDIRDAGTHNPLAQISLPRASRPGGIALNDAGTTAYVTLEATGMLASLDTASRTLTQTIPLGNRPRAVAYHPQADKIYVSRFVSGAASGQIYVVDATSFTLSGVINLAFDQTLDSEDGGRGVPNYLNHVVISPDGVNALVTAKKDNVARGAFRDGLPLDHDNTVRAIALILDAGIDSEVLELRHDFNNNSLPVAAAYSPLGDWAFVALQGTNEIVVLDAYQTFELTSIGTELAPDSLTYDASTDTLYVHNFLSRSLSAYDVSNVVVGGTQAALLAVHQLVANEALSAEVLLGKQIFYNAADTRMSSEGYLSCATCHLDGEDDGQIWDFTDRGEGLRNNISLLGRAGMGHGNVHWTANFDEIQDFEGDIRQAFGGSGFLSDGQFSSTSDPLGTAKAGLNTDLDALAAYVASLDRVPDSPHRDASGSLTSEAVQGRSLFASLGCDSCHSGDAKTDGLTHDVGTLTAASGQRLGGPLSGIETPTLKGIWYTAPYFHDGSASTLREVIDRSGEAHGNAAALTEEEKTQLEAYLLQLDETLDP